MTDEHGTDNDFRQFPARVPTTIYRKGDEPEEEKERVRLNYPKSAMDERSEG